jgi:RNA polymerase sigma factor (sigma-70 family)
MTKEQTKLVVDNLWLPKQEAKRWKHIPIDQDDLIQEGNIGLIKAAKNFDPSYGVPFHIHARSRVRGQITDFVRQRARKSMVDKETKEYAKVVHFSTLENPSNDGDEREIGIADDRLLTPDAALEASEQLGILDGIPPRERYTLVRIVVDGASHQEIASELGVGLATVQVLSSNAQKRVRKRAESYAGQRTP